MQRESVKSKMRRNCLSVLLLLCLLLLQDVEGSFLGVETDESCQDSHRLEEYCGPYAHTIVKPMMAYFDQVTQKIAEMEIKNETIKELEKDIRTCATKDTIITELKDKYEVNRELVKSLREQIGFLTKSNEKLEGEIVEIKANCKKDFKYYNDQSKTETGHNSKQIETLEQKINDFINVIEKQNIEKQTKEMVEMRDKCEKDLKLYNEKIVLLETEVNNTAINSNNKLESLKQQLKLLTNSIDTKDRQINEFKLKAKGEAVKLVEYESQLKNQNETILAKDENIHRLETEVKKFNENKRNKKGCIGRDSSGVYNVTIFKDTAFEVLCNSDIAGPGWTVIQQRIRGGVEFQRDWNTYRNGFGDFWDGDFFLGLEKIHRLTTEQPHELYIHMQYFNGSTIYARYDEFLISGEDDQYRLSKLGIFSSTTTEDRFSYHKYMKFTTYDRDNDEYPKNCAKDFRYGGWWYDYCCVSNMNGKYSQSVGNDYTIIFWGDSPSLKQVRMMIRSKAA